MADSSVEFDLLSNSELIALARTGHHSAFNELMLRHRKQAFEWAHQYTDDSYLAEDIVQEALINAFLYLGNLEQIEKFIPWFRRIITNQALMHLRRGGPHGKERPFSSLIHQHSEQNDEDGTPIELLLSKFARQRSEMNHALNDPAKIWLRQERADLIHSMLQCLNAKEREIFDAYFFKLYTHQEISTMTSTSSSNVYTILSRSRRKIQQQQYHTNLTNYLQERASDPVTNSKVILESKSLYFGEIWDTFSLCVLHAQQYIQSPYTRPSYSTMAEIMGLSGLAFRLQINQLQLDLFEASAFNWGRTFTKGLLNIGYAVRSIGDGQHIPQTSDLLIEAFTFIHNTLDQGQPVIVWGYIHPYFALIHGYDDNKKLFHITGLFEQQTMDYRDLGLDWGADLFVLSLGTPYPVSLMDSLRGALSMIIMHYEGLEGSVHPDYVQGIAAFDVWITLLSREDIDPLAHAYQISWTSNTRMFAYQFLESIAERTEDFDDIICEFASKAAFYYKQTAETFNTLRKIFPFPAGGDHTCASTREKGTVLLKQAKSFEQQGLATLKKIFNHISN
ncbi:ECF RNA polymerase sigma factor SigM [compost metagenome]